MEKELKAVGEGKKELTTELLAEAKRIEFPDNVISRLTGIPQEEIKKQRYDNGIRAAYKMVDTCAAEFAAATPYYYSVYGGPDTENEAKAKTVAEQDKALNTAWFVFGTKKELKDQNILTNTGLFQKKQVLKDSDINKDYFTQVDIRTTKEIKLYSKSADVLTTHPAGSYALEKDDKDQLVLKITNPKDFWSVSRYLVIQVK